MAKFDFFPDPGSDGYLLEVQSDLLDGLNTRVVVPLIARAKAPRPATRLNPVFTIEGGEYVMMTQFMAAVPTTILKTPRGNVKDDFDAFTAAIDMLIQGF